MTVFIHNLANKKAMFLNIGNENDNNFHGNL